MTEVGVIALMGYFLSFALVAAQGFPSAWLLLSLLV